MADHGAHYTRGEMDISEQTASFALFNGLTKWGSLGLAALLLLLVVWFCTKGGFVAGAIAAVVLTTLGVIFLRDKPGSAH